MYHETLKSIRDIYYTETIGEQSAPETPIDQAVDIVVKKSVEVFKSLSNNPRNEYGASVVDFTIVTDIYNQEYFNQNKDKRRWFAVNEINISNETADQVRKDVLQKLKDNMQGSEIVVQIYNSDTVGGFYIKISNKQ